MVRQGFLQGLFGGGQGLLFAGDFTGIGLGAALVFGDLDAGLGKVFITLLRVGFGLLRGVLERGQFGDEFGGALFRLDDALGDQGGLLLS